MCPQLPLLVYKVRPLDPMKYPAPHLSLDDVRGPRPDAFVRPPRRYAFFKQKRWGWDPNWHFAAWVRRWCIL